MATIEAIRQFELRSYLQRNGIPADDLQDHEVSQQYQYHRLQARRLEDSDYSEFVDSFVECLLWSEIVYLSDSEDSEPEPADDYFTEDAIDDSGMAEILIDCADFYDNHKHHIQDEYCLTRYNAIAQAGHDFCLTRNGHGTGFWDCGRWEKPQADALTEASESAGTLGLYAYDSSEPEAEEAEGKTYRLSTHN